MKDQMWYPLAQRIREIKDQLERVQIELKIERVKGFKLDLESFALKASMVLSERRSGRIE